MTTSLDPLYSQEPYHSVPSIAGDRPHQLLAIGLISIPVGLRVFVTAERFASGRDG